MLYGVHRVSLMAEEWEDDPPMTTIHVEMLGGFSIYEEGSTGTQINVAGRARQIWSLVAYLILHRVKGVSAQELIDVLWPDAERENPVGTLKNNISRARTALEKLGLPDAKELIQCKGGFYYWAPDCVTTLDAEEFEQQAEASGEETDPAEAVEKAKSALALYKGDFLPTLSYGSWTTPLSAWYRTVCIKMCRQAANQLKELGRYEELVQLARRAFEIDPSVEEFSVHLMRSLMETGDPKQALSHYTHVKRLFMDNYGASPSPELELAQNEAVQMLYGQDMTKSELTSFLQEQDLDAGAFYCECSIFREIVQLYARSMKRTGRSCQILVISLERPESAEKQALQIKWLEQVLSQALRGGDPYTKVSTTRMLVLLPGATTENGKLVIDRIMDRLRVNYPRSGLKLNWRIYDLGTLNIQ